MKWEDHINCDARSKDNKTQRIDRHILQRKKIKSKKLREKRE